MLRLLRDLSDAFSDVCKRERWLIPKSKGRASDKTSVQRDTLDTSRAGQSLCRVICRDKIDKIAFQLVNRMGGWVGKRSSAGRREGKARGGEKNIENERRDKSCWHNVSTIRFAGRRTAFYFCFAPIIDEPCRCFCLTNGRCLCDLALFALHPFTSLRIALRSRCLFSFFSLSSPPSSLPLFRFSRYLHDRRTN